MNETTVFLGIVTVHVYISCTISILAQGKNDSYRSWMGPNTLGLQALKSWEGHIPQVQYGELAPVILTVVAGCLSHTKYGGLGFPQKTFEI